MRPRAPDRVFIGGRDEPRARRATDGLLLSASALGLLLVSVAAFPEPRLASLADTFLTAWPDFLNGLWQAVADLLVLLALGLVVAAALTRRLALTRDMVLSALVAAAGWTVVSRLTHDTWPDLSHLDQVGPPPLYPAARLAFPAAVVLAASPHLTLPARRVCRWVVGLAAPGAVVLGATTSLGVAAGLLLAVAAAAVVHLAFGSSAGRPALEHVRQGLEEIGVATVRLDAADRQEAGLFVVDAEGASGESLVVKVYGRDARDTALIATLWRTVWFREPGSPARLGRLDQVEHEALLTLLAGQAGVHTDEVVTAGATDDGNALLVLKRDGALLDDVPDARLDDAQIHALWDAIGRLHDARIAHGRLDARALIAADGSVTVVGFRGATVAASEAQRRTDDAQALVTTALRADEGRAVAIARERLGEDGLGATIPYVQPPALTSTQRRDLRKQGTDLDALRTAAAAAAGVEAPALLQLRRFSIGSIVRVLLPALALVVLISAAGGIDWDEVKDSLAAASWWLVAIGVVFSQTPRFTQSLATLGASPIPIPLGPLYALQLAVSYVNLAIPSSAARVAVNIRFFQRHGVPPGAAMAAGAMDGFSGFVVQATLLVGLLLFTPVSLDIQLDDATSGGVPGVVWVVLVIVVIGAGVLVVVPRLRRFISTWARRLGSEALQAVRGLSVRRLGLLFGGNLATEILFASSLGIFVRALGFSVGLDELLLINISVALLSGLLPVPGGIGVAEGGLLFGLTQAGMPEESAFAAVILYRLATFYLPPIWGFFALRWLERNQHL